MAHQKSDRNSNRQICCFPEGDQWRAVIKFGIMISAGVRVATKAEAIAAAYELAEKYPDAELAPLHLGCVKA